MPRRPRLPTFTDGDLTLRRFRDEDRAARMRLGRDPEIHRLLGGDPEHEPPFTLLDAAEWLRRLRRDRYAWAIDYCGRLVGAIRLSLVDSQATRGDLAVSILDPALLGLGLGRRAIRLVLTFGFERLGLHRVGLRVIAANQRAIRCYLACGFKVEGREREAVALEGAWQDDLLMGVLRAEYEAAREPTATPAAARPPAAQP
jgi:RimJ/RimL family protein N-acetyltransferase